MDIGFLIASLIAVIVFDLAVLVALHYRTRAR